MQSNYPPNVTGFEPEITGGPEPIPAEEYIFGKWMTAEQLVEHLNKISGARTKFFIDSHEDDYLTLGINFKEYEEPNEERDEGW